MPRGENTVDKLKVLTAHLSASIYKLLSEETTYKSAITALQNLFVKPKNEICARHMLATAKQDAGESVDKFILGINKLSQNCDFTAVSAQAYKDHMKRDSFINGLSSNFIRQRLLENRTLTFTEAHEKARSIELAKLNCETYTCEDTSFRQMCALQNDETKSKENNVSVIASKKQSRNFTCYFCGESKWHPRSRCPAKNEICDFCQKVGHNAKYCLKRNFTCYFCGESKWHPSSRCLAKNEICDFCQKVGHYVKCCLKRQNSLNCVDQPCLAPTTALQSIFSQYVLAEITVNNISGQALVDTGSTNSYLNKEFMKRNKLPYKTIKYFANMANVFFKTKICGVSYLDLTFLEHHYKNFKFYVMSNLIADSIIGDDL